MSQSPSQQAVLDNKQTKHFLQNQINISTNTYKEKSMHLNEIKYALKDVNDFPDNHEMYKSYGRLFIKIPQPVARLDMEEKQNNLLKDIERIQNTIESLNKQIVKSDEKMNDIIHGELKKVK
ncbi:hypothetical protein A3Q56_06972 [Intoshia linei]|uniref:Prefoldin subunit 1 n=1 Tax=Intoshia linei TaxID=1819745 RepID=A0A177ATI2_9BILA|nr:hypothetical protein A3Q56_06972 [Intoshia linei]